VSIHDETPFHFQHPDNGCPMYLTFDDDDRPIVLLEDWAEEESKPEELENYRQLARSLTKAVRFETTLYNAAVKLSKPPYHCEDIFR
jgi:hypothetical protein